MVIEIKPPEHFAQAGQARIQRVGLFVILDRLVGLAEIGLQIGATQDDIDVGRFQRAGLPERFQGLGLAAQVAVGIGQKGEGLDIRRRLGGGLLIESAGAS